MAKKIITTTIAEDQSSITFEIEGKLINVQMAELNSGVATRAAVHGLIQKISDAAAIQGASPDEKYEAMLSVRDRLIGPDGSWNKRSGDGEPSAPSGLIFRAVYEHTCNRATAAGKTPPTIEAVRAVYDAKPRADQLAFRRVPEVAAIMERMKSERGSSATVADVDAMLEELGI